MARLFSDTSPDVEAKLIEGFRRMTPSARLSLALSLSDEVIALSRRAIARVHPEYTELEVGLKFVEVHYGVDLAERVRERLRRKGQIT